MSAESEQSNRPVALLLCCSEGLSVHIPRTHLLRKVGSAAFGRGALTWLRFPGAPAAMCVSACLCMRVHVCVQRGPSRSRAGPAFPCCVWLGCSDEFLWSTEAGGSLRGQADSV